MHCTAYFCRNVLLGTCNPLIYVRSFLKCISHRSLLNYIRSDTLWFNCCFHDTAPICIPAVALGTSLLQARISPVVEACLQAPISSDPPFGISPGESNPSVAVLWKWTWIIQNSYPTCLQGIDAKKQTDSILCMVRALGVKAALKSHCSFPKWYSLPGVGSGFLTCTSIKFPNKVGRRETGIYWESAMSQTRITLQTDTWSH